MRLPSLVMDAMRGLGGAVLITAAAGCGSAAVSSQEPIATQNAPVVLAEVHTPPPAKPPPPPVEAEEWPLQESYPDAHPACGRG